MSFLRQNSVNLIGRVVGDVTTNNVKKNDGTTTTVTELRISVPGAGTNSEYNGKITNVGFITVKAWGKAGEFASQLQKGDDVAVTGQFKQDVWTTQNNEKREKIVIQATDISAAIANKAAASGTTGSSEGPKEYDPFAE